jgi:hypothetical protein
VVPPKTVPAAVPEADKLPDMPTGLNYYCALYKRNLAMGAPGALLDKYLKKCQGQDCDNNRVLDQNDAVGLFDFCKWTDELGFCYLHAPAAYCYANPDDSRCYCEENCGGARQPKYKYDPTCGKGYDAGGYECYGSHCEEQGFTHSDAPVEGESMSAVEGDKSVAKSSLLQASNS